jgi:hypothetical protein
MLGRPKLGARSPRPRQANLDQDQPSNRRREDAITRWIERHGFHEAWQIAPNSPSWASKPPISNPAGRLPRQDAIQVVLEQFASALRAEHYAQAMLSSTSRIFDLISAIKTYSYMDRASILEVDVPPASTPPCRCSSRAWPSQRHPRLRAQPAHHQRLRQRAQPGLDRAH